MSSLRLKVKKFSFTLTHELITSRAVLQNRIGWLICLENSRGKIGWGEVSPLNSCDLESCGTLLNNLGDRTSHEELEEGISIWPKALGFGFGAALGELAGLVGSKPSQGWLKAPPSAILLPNNQSLLDLVESCVQRHKEKKLELSLKWKVAINPPEQEVKMLLQIFELLPNSARLRIDANGGWNREQANYWLQYLENEPRLEWLEQPLPPEDLEGLTALSKKIPIALDESLLLQPSLCNSWSSWQIRHPLLEGDPRPLLGELQKGVGYRVISTGFETGIGQRWVSHMAALQQLGSTPTAPGLAPGWSPNSQLFSSDPTLVWEAA